MGGSRGSDKDTGVEEDSVYSLFRAKARMLVNAASCLLIQARPARRQALFVKDIADAIESSGRKDFLRGDEHALGGIQHGNQVPGDSSQACA